MTGVVLLLAAVALTTRQALVASRRPPVGVAVGLTAPEFALQKAGEPGEVELASLRGKPLVLNFFCGCGDCSEVAAVWAKHAKELGDAQLIAVNHDSTSYNPSALKNFRWASGFKWAVLADIGSTVSLKWRSLECPRVWVLDGDGVIRWEGPGRTAPALVMVNGALKALRELD
jgi:peroxiredoxin